MHLSCLTIELCHQAILRKMRGEENEGGGGRRIRYHGLLVLLELLKMSLFRFGRSCESVVLIEAMTQQRSSELVIMLDAPSRDGGVEARREEGHGTRSRAPAFSRSRGRGGDRYGRE
jgi:hypothetical protein